MFNNTTDSKWDQIDQAFQGGGKSLFNKDTPPGATYQGTIEDVDYKQASDYNSGQPAFFPSGDPKMQFIIRLTGVTPQDGPDDDGERTLFVNAWGGRKKALFNAISNAGFTKASEALAPGNNLHARYIGEQQQSGNNGSYTEKVYEYAIKKGTPAAAAIDQAFQQAPQQPQQAPQQAPAPFGTPPQQPQPQTPQQAPGSPWETPQPAPQQAQQNTDPATTAQNLIRQGLTDQQIGDQLNLDPSVVTILRQQTN